MAQNQNGIVFSFNAVVVSWDSCYRRGLSCMEGECWKYVIEEFAQVISLIALRYTDLIDGHPWHY